MAATDKLIAVRKGDQVRWADRTWVVNVVEGERAVVRTRAGGQYVFRIVPLAALSHRKEADAS